MSRHSDVHTKARDALCDVTCINERKVKRVLRKLGTESDIASLAGLYKVLGDPTRVKILRALSLEELCVCDIAALVGLSQSAISHQLRFLRISRLVKYRRQGKMAYYALDDDHVRQLLEKGLRHVREDK